MSEHKNDPLIERYRAATAQEQAGPSAHVREAVLARAAAVANTHALEKALPKKEAANDGAWRWKVAASVAVIGFTGMVARHYIDATPPERMKTRASANTAEEDAPKNKPNDQLAEMAAAATPLKSLGAPPPAPASRALDGSTNEVADRRAPLPSASVASTNAAAPTLAQSSVLRKEIDTMAAPRHAQTSAPEPMKNAPLTPEPSSGVIERPVAGVRDQVASAQSVPRRQPEMSTGDAPLAAPIAAAPTAKIAAAPSPAPAPSAPSAEASLSPPMAAVPAPSAPAQIAAGAVMRARAAPARAESGLTMPAEPALIAAIRSGDSEALRRELAAGASPNALARDGTPALTLAAQRGRSDEVAAFLRAGANVNARDVHGRTALSIALAQGDAEIVAVLRAAGGVE